MILRLAWMQYRGWLRRFIRGLRQPKKLLGLFGMAVFVGLLILPHLMGVDSGTLRFPREGLAVLCGMFYLMAVLFGLTHRGPNFSPADVDMLFAAPLTRRELLAYRLLVTYPKAMLGGVFLFVLIAWRLPHPWVFLASFAIMQVTIVQIQMGIAVLMVGVQDSLLSRFKPWLQAIGFLMVIGAIALLAPTMIGVGGLQSVIANAMDSPGWRLAFLPALTCVETAMAETPQGVLAGLGAQLAVFFFSLCFALIPPIDYLEASLQTSKRIAKSVGRMRQGGLSESQAQKQRKSRRSSSALFRGPGCLVYKNAIAMGRSWRTIAFSLAMLSLIAAPSFMASMEGGGSNLPVFVMVIIVMVPIVISAQCNFDFRREGDSLPVLKSLPFSPLSITFAEVLVPWLFCLTIQAILLLIVAVFMRGVVDYLSYISLTVPLSSLALFLVENISFFLFSHLNAGESSKSGLSGGGTFLIRMVGLVAAFVPPSLAGYFTYQASLSLPLGFCVFGLVFLAIDLLLLILLARMFERKESFRGE